MIVVQGKPRQKVIETVSQKTSQVWWSTFVIPATWQAEIRGLLSEVKTEKKFEALSEK
jgi:hypothetical protein